MPISTGSSGGARRMYDSFPIDQLFLDPKNPRLPESAQGGQQQDLLSVLLAKFNLEPLAESLTQNGYFQEEPLVGIPEELPPALSKPLRDFNDKQHSEFSDYVHSKETSLTIVEGNRRLATCKLLTNPRLRRELGVGHWPEATETIQRDLSSLPVIVYPIRNEIVPYLGVKHITGIQKWDAYAKARYLDGLDKEGRNLIEVQKEIGDKRGSARKNLIAFRMLEQLETEFGFDTSPAKEKFSLLVLAIGQGGIKQFLDIPRKLTDVNYLSPVSGDKLENLRNLVSWLFGDKKQNPVIHESRDITSYLSHVLTSEDATKYLVENRQLLEAYDRSDGEEAMLIKYLSTASRKLDTALGIAHRHKTSDVEEAAVKCEETAKQLVKTVQSDDD